MLGRREAGWLGGRRFSDQTDLEWLDGTAWTYSNWASGEPNNNRNKEECVNMMNKYYYQWNDYPCWLTSSFICKKETVLTTSEIDQNEEDNKNTTEVDQQKEDNKNTTEIDQHKEDNKNTTEIDQQKEDNKNTTELDQHKEDNTNTTEINQHKEDNRNTTEIDQNKEDTKNTTEIDQHKEDKKNTTEIDHNKVDEIITITTNSSNVDQDNVNTTNTYEDNLQCTDLPLSGILLTDFDHVHMDIGHSLKLVCPSTEKSMFCCSPKCPNSHFSFQFPWSFQLHRVARKR